MGSSRKASIRQSNHEIEQKPSYGAVILLIRGMDNTDSNLWPVDNLDSLADVQKRRLTIPFQSVYCSSIVLVVFNGQHFRLPI